MSIYMNVHSTNIGDIKRTNAPVVMKSLIKVTTALIRQYLIIAKIKPLTPVNTTISTKYVPSANLIKKALVNFNHLLKHKVMMKDANHTTFHFA